MTTLPPHEVFAVQQLMHDFWSRTDRVSGLPAEVLFADDARMRLGTLIIEGREEVDRYHVERRAKEDETGRRVRHFCTNHLFDGYDGRTVSVYGALLTFQGVGQMPFESSLPSNIADFMMRFRRVDEGQWLILEVDGTVVFSGPGAPPNAR